MIDKKKINEAIHEVYNSNAIFRRYEQAEIAFKSGINWFLDNLWHDASEEPKENVDILYEYWFDNSKKFCRMDIHKPSYSWQEKIINNRITRWLYIDDLMKGEK